VLLSWELFGTPSHPALKAKEPAGASRSSADVRRVLPYFSKLSLSAEQREAVVSREPAQDTRKNRKSPARGPSQDDTEIRRPVREPGSSPTR
jgi:hypothetical protein